MTSEQYRDYQQKQQIQKTKFTRAHAKPKMNKSEAVWAQRLELEKKAGEVECYWFESLKFRLAENTWYTPDFVVLYTDGRREIHEIKGFLRDDAAVKFKVARELYPDYDWQMWRRKKTVWERVY